VSFGDFIAFASLFGQLVESSIVSFSDDGLEAAVREAIGRPEGSILAADVVELASGRAIVDLTGLSGLTALSYVRLDSNRISDISELEELPALETLSLRINNLSDVSALSSLRSLTSLDLAINRIDSIPSLSSLTALTSLYLGGNNISDVSPLSGLTGLTQLSLLGMRSVTFPACPPSLH
jgi:hypothetical protein